VSSHAEVASDPPRRGREALRRSRHAACVLPAVLLAVLLSCCGQLSAAECPSVNRRAELQAEAALPDTVDASIRRQRWDSLTLALRACNLPDAEAAALSAWSSQSLLLQARAESMLAENRRYALSLRADLPFHRAQSAARLAILLDERGEVETAGRYLREASKIFESIGEFELAADAQSDLSRSYRSRGNYLAALAEERVALSLRRRIMPTPILWRSLLSIAVLYEQLNLLDDAERRYSEALKEVEGEGNPVNIALVRASFAGFLNDFGPLHAQRALWLATQALETQRNAGNTVQLTSALLQVGRAQLNLDALEAAQTNLDEALVKAQSYPRGVMVAHVQTRLGELELAKGNPESALIFLQDARETYAAKANRHRLAKVYALLEKVYERQGDRLQAAQAARESLRLRDELTGASAPAQLGELLSRFELSEERVRSERLEREKAVTELTLIAERRQLQSIYIVLLAIGVGLLLLGWRHRTARRLYRLLQDQHRKMLAQSEELSAANQRLTEQSERLYQSATTDALTGLHNRAHGMQRLQELLADGHGTAAAILIDVDHFKLINDSYGHPVGDKVLCCIAGAMRSALGANAELSRIGGEEFMVLLPRTSSEDAMLAAEGLRAAVATQVIVLATQQTLTVTISAGICALADGPKPSVQRTLTAADAALYQAKRSGRDRVWVQSVDSAAV